MGQVLERTAAIVAGLWGGVLLCIGAFAAPTAFATLALADAGRFVARLFAQEAYLSIALGVALVVIERYRFRGDAAPAGSSIFSVNLALALGTVFCTVAGYFAIVPMMQAARAGQGSVSFLTLHAISGGLFALKGLLVLVLAWRLAGRTPARRTSLRAAATS